MEHEEMFLSFPKIFYLDTNCLVYARHYLMCKHLDQISFPQNVITGKTIIDALEICENKREQISVVTSHLVNFEFNNRFRTSVIKRVYLDYGFPLESIDGKPQDILANMDKQPEDIRQSCQRGIEENQNWYRNWEYRSLVSFENLSAEIFSIATPIPFTTPGIDLMDALHLATALSLGASYFVSNDGPLLNHTRTVINEAQRTSKLPNGADYVEPLQAIKPKQFLEIVRNMKPKHE